MQRPGTQQHSPEPLSKERSETEIEAMLLWKRMKGNFKIAVKDGTESTKDKVRCWGVEVAGAGWGRKDRNAATGILMKEQFLSHISTARSQTESCLEY